jgi:hypothetical protein
VAGAAASAGGPDAASRRPTATAAAVANRSGAEDMGDLTVLTGFRLYRAVLTVLQTMPQLACGAAIGQQPASGARWPGRRRRITGPP